MNRFLALLFFIPFLSSAQEKNIPIQVHLAGIPDDTLFYLNDNKRNIDSALSKAGVLQFSYLKKSSGPQGLLLISKDKKQGYLFWIEDNPLKLKGIFGELTPLSAEGSKSQNEFKEYVHLTQDLEKTFNEARRKLQDAKRHRNPDTATIQADVEKSKKSLKDQNISFIESHPESIISTYDLLLQTVRKSFTTEETLGLFHKLGKEQQNSFYGQSVLKSLQVFQNPKTGSQAPFFSMNDLNGKPIALTDYKGKNVVLVFWASWCVPCRKEIPQIKEAIDDFKNQNFVFIAISNDEDKDAWTKAIQTDKVSWINISDLNGWLNEISLIYGVTAIPDHFLIDTNGRIVERSGQFSIIRKKMSELTLK